MINVKRILSKILFFIGICFIIYAGFLYIQNQSVENFAQNHSTQALEEIKIKIEDDKENQENQVLFDGDLYLGILEIPILGIELPIQKFWSFDKLKYTPCVYQEYPFSIAGHNYVAHFANLGKLKINDEVRFTYINGKTDIYKVVEVKVIKDTDIDELKDTRFDLNLFTCTYSNKSQRILVRLNLSNVI